MSKAKDLAVNNGLVLINSTTVTAASSVTLSNIFSSSYKTYKIIGEFPESSASGDLTFQLTLNGTAAATTYQQMGRGLTSAGSSADMYGGNNTNVFICNYGSYPPSNAFEFDIVSPNLPLKTYGFMQTSYIASGYPSFRAHGFIHEVSTAYDGLKFNASSGTITGTLKVYGYK